MTVAATCFKWVDLLESQFDKSWTELDSLLLPLEDDEDFSLVYTRSRRHTSSLASCFSQLCHKASVVFQNNAKLEAELLHLREELSSAQATIEQCNKEKLYLAQALQDSLSRNHKIQHSSGDDTDHDLSSVLSRSSSQVSQLSSRDSHLCSRLSAENERLRSEMIELESEMIGARLDNVYLDKELAGRIQQIQLLLASNTPAEVKEKMWSQIESEMCLQRSKTIAQMCRTKQEVKARLTLTPDSRDEDNAVSGATETSDDADNNDNDDHEEHEERRGKQVMVLKNPADDIGMAILGGKDHNLPIIISEIFPDSALSRCSR